jgi:xenotropic and polytropic retrovirus receptor 1
VLAFINATYTSVWDVAMDCSLGNPYASHPFLRDLLAFRPVWVYYVAMIFDVLVRFNWIFYAIFVHDIQHSALLSFFVAFSEICRRGVWTVFRVENEHCANVHMFRALRDVPLPFDIPPPSSVPDGGATSADIQFAGRHTRTPTIASVSADVEIATAQEERPTIPRYRPSIVQMMTRVGTLMASAHAQDFQRRKRLDPLSGEPGELESHGAEDTSDEEEEDSHSLPHAATFEESLPGPATNLDR